MHSIGIFFTLVTALYVTSAFKLSRACGSHTRTGDSESPGRRIEHITAEYLISKASFFCFYISLNNN